MFLPYTKDISVLTKRTGRSIDSQLKRGSEFSDDISAYDLILKNKERLLSFDKHIAAIEKETEEKSGSLVREETPDRLRLTDVTISVPAMDENKRTREIISSASCTIKSGEHVILKGPSGSGIHPSPYAGGLLAYVKDISPCPPL